MDHGTSFHGPAPETHFLSLRIYQPFWKALEQLAIREHISMNSLVNALLDLALELDDTPEGQARLHEVCVEWRSRWERKLTTRRLRRAQAHVTEDSMPPVPDEEPPDPKMCNASARG